MYSSVGPVCWNNFWKDTNFLKKEMDFPTRFDPGWDTLGQMLSFLYYSYGIVDLYRISTVIRAGSRLKGTKAEKSLFHGYH